MQDAAEFFHRMFRKEARMIYERIEALCKDRGVSIRKLEVECGLSNGSIAKWKTVSPVAESLYRVAVYLDTTVEELLKEAN